MSQKIKCKHMDCHISISSELSLLVEMLEGTNKKRKWFALRGVKILTGCQANTMFTAELHPKSYIENQFITYFKCFIYARSYTEEHRDTQGTDTDFSFYCFLIFIEVSLGKRNNGRSFILSSTNVMELGWGWKFQVKLFKISKLIHLFLILEKLVS